MTLWFLLLAFLSFTLWHQNHFFKARAVAGLQLWAFSLSFSLFFFLFFFGGEGVGGGGGVVVD